MVCLNERANSSARKASGNGKLESKGGWIYRKEWFSKISKTQKVLHGKENDDDDEKTSNNHPESAVPFIAGE